MKRSIAILILITAVLCLGCQGESKTRVNIKYVEDISVTSTPAPNSAPVTLGGSVVDMDITKLSDTLAYSQVCNMWNDCEPWLGKTVKLKGVYNSAVDDTTGTFYCSCGIMDATACCSAGFEFTLDGKEYPTDYPAEGAEITVVGTLDRYYEGENFHLTLRSAKLED